MSNDLGRPVTLVSPRTGEALTLDSPTEDLAGFVADVREQKRLLDEAKNYAEREILRRLDLNRKWTVHAPGVKVTAPSPKQDEAWDGATLREALLGFVDQGELGIEAVDAAVETIVEYKVKKAGINALRAGGGEIADAVNLLVMVSEPRRYVSVTRA